MAVLLMHIENVTVLPAVQLSATDLFTIDSVKSSTGSISQEQKRACC